MQLFVVEQLVKLTREQVAKRSDILNNATNRLKRAQGIKELKETAYNQAVNTTNDAQSLYDIAANLVNKFKQALSDMTALFITAQTESAQAASDLAKAQLNQQLAHQDVTDSFQTIMDAKQLLQAYTSTATLLDFNVSTASNDKGIAGF